MTAKTAKTETDLTRRELQVLTALCQGKTAQQVADEQFTSVKTVNFHSNNIHDKWNVHSVIQAYNEAIQRGLIQPPCKRAEAAHRGAEGAKKTG